MGLLFSKIWAMFGKEEHKIVILGLDNAGKTTILYQLIMDEVVQTSPTIGSNVEEVTFRNIHFVMWDLGGQQSLRQTWATYFMNAEFVILVVDSTDSERLTLVKSELDNLMLCDDLQSASFLILANKQDVKSSLSPALISRELNLDKYKTRHWQIQPCCALTGEGLVQGMEWIVSRIKR